MKFLLKILLVLGLLAAFVGAGQAFGQTVVTNSLLFSGTDPHVSVANFGDIMPTNEVTVEFWADTSKLAVQSVFMLSPDQGTNRFNAHINYSDGPTFGNTYWDFGNVTSGGRLGAVPAPVNSLNHWVHYAFVASQGSNSMQIYTNGSLASTKSGMTPLVRGNYSLQIGGPGFPYHGRISDFRVWNVARSQTEIQANFATRLTGNEAGLLLYYRFDNTNSFIATNLATVSGAAYNATINFFRTVSNVNDSGPGSLRQTIASATSGDTIYFNTNLSGKTIVLTNGELALNKSLTLDASLLPSGLVLDGRHTSRIFNVGASSTTVMTGFIITNGTTSGTFPDGYGGGIFNSGNLTLLNCALVGSTAFVGGAAYNSGNLVLNNSTVSGNLASYGGGIQNEQNLLATNSTFAGNTASVNGGAINATFGRPLTLNFCSIASNFCAIGAGIKVVGSGSTINNTIIAGNSGGNNVDGDPFDGGNNLTSGPPLLATLGFYGGKTQTMPPTAGSPAIDAGGATSLTTDQRGLRRIVGASADIGAAEFQDASPLVVNNADSGVGSLRFALTYCPIGSHITFTNTLSGSSIVLTSGEFFLNQNVTIDASSLSNGITLDGNQADRIFEVDNATVVLNSLTIANGLVTNNFGGGAIFNFGTLTINRSTLTGNVAPRGGGAIGTEGTLTLNECTLQGNTAHGGLGGGAIVVYTGVTTLNQCTLSGNSATNTRFGGGCILNAAGLNCTNSIIADNQDGDLENYGNLALGGANIIKFLENKSTFGRGIVIGPIPISANALLAPFGNYGGPTMTMPPLAPASPAVDACIRGTTFTTDQRGFPRLVGARADIGAVEVQASSISTPTLNVSSPTNTQLLSNPFFTVIGTAHDNVAVSNVLYSLNGSGWQVATTSNSWADWTAPLTLTPGTNTFAAYALNYSGKLSSLKTIKFIYVVSSTLTVAVNGPGAITPVNYSNIVLQVGRGYSVTGTATQPGFALKNWTDGLSNVLSSAATLPFVMSSNLSLIANFVDVQLPTAAITNVASIIIVSNELFTVKGRAEDNVAVSNVLVRLNNGSWNSATPGNTFTNWSTDLPLIPGTNVVSVYAVDSSGNQSLTNTVKLFYLVASTLTVAVNGPGTITPANYTNISLAIGKNYILTGTPNKAGFVLTNWMSGSNVLGNKPALTFIMTSNLALTANFVDNTRPILTVTTPTAASVGSAIFSAKGKATDNAGVTNVLYNLNNLGWLPPDSTNHWADWSKALELTPGTNTLLAYAVDASGNISATNSIKFIYTTAPATLNGLAAKVTPDGGITFGSAFGATTFNQVSTDDSNNPNAVGTYTYTKQTPTSGQLNLTYTAPPTATNEGLQSIRLNFIAPNIARFTNGVDSGDIVFTSTPAVVQPTILNQTVVAMSADGGVQAESITFTAGKYTSSNLVTHVLGTNTGYTYTTYGPAGALLKHTNTNGQTYLMFNFFGTNYGTVHWQNYTAAGVFTNAHDLDFGLASQRPGGNAPTNLIGRSFVYADTSHVRTFFLDATNASFAAAPDISGNDYIFSFGPNGTYSYNRTNSNTGTYNSSLTGSGLYSIQFIAPNFGYVDLLGIGYPTAVLLR